MVIGLRLEQVEAYKALHAGPGVRHLLRQANIRNFCIYLRQMDDGRCLEFAHFEYVGSDYAADMDSLMIQKVYVSQPLYKTISGGHLSIDRSQIIEVTDKYIKVRDVDIKVEGAVPVAANA